MSQADGKHNLRRLVLHFPGEGDNGWYRFKVNPEEYTLDMPQRTSVIKTKSDIVVEDYGKDIETITFSGTTGFKPIREGNRTMSGKDKMDELQNMVEKYADSGGSGNRNASPILFYNMTDNKYYKVHLAPQGLRITRSKDEPLLFRYEITLLVLCRAFEPDRNSIADPEIGNVAPSTEQDLINRLDTMYPPAVQARRKNNEDLSIHNNNSSNRMPSSQQSPRKYSQTANGRNVYNPRATTNGLRGSVNNMAMIIGYGNGGVGI